ncbi:histone chaperone domain-containing protein [Penicillium digitatum]|uniref:Histone chaperone domain-containing protein n=3 Tax=Penicillium digitatum TaxID=36651 RepID=K9GQH5_PEND2|nr:hypothetical protein PDIP_60990 [Penicillium digitatum Pd1]EKV10253.1 hypothetical protein PDIP_60990 [Penicillium digitatum Pd1]EKV15351.1 hypothetical protein PDIG_26540 [Penicillium digitatum PHI26]KAG0157389.1 hypothetical protein PDIDSM_4574 [Penicillium digitatum]QQK44284.1 histone chaperone domain-containing protein [Penicillium digitatum]
MSNAAERIAEDNYERENDPSPVTEDFAENSYAKEPKSYLRDQVPVQPDEQSFEDPIQPPYSNSDEQLEDDEREAIDKSNVMRGDRLRHAKPRTANKYNEGPDENDLPSGVD